MDLKELWNSGPAVAPSQPDPEREALAAMLRKESGGVLKQLRNKLFYKLMWGVAIALGVLLLAYFSLPNQAAALLMLITSALCFIFVFFIARFYQRLPNRLDMSREILPVMKEYDHLVRGALQIEQKLGNYFIAISPVIGALYSGLEKHSFMELVTDWKWLLLYAVVAAIFTPLGIWLSKWMNKVAFGKYLDQLSSNISALEKVEAEPENPVNFLP